MKPGEVIKARLFLSDKLFSKTVIGYFYKSDTTSNYLKCELYNKNDETFPLSSTDKPYKIIRVPDINPGLDLKEKKPDIIKLIGKFKMGIKAESKFYIKADASFLLLFDNNIIAEQYVQSGVRTLTEFQYKPKKPDVGIVLEYAIGQGGAILEMGNVDASGKLIPLTPENYIEY
jgi:hypothetical protein